ncbi:LacI family DNA-binding transcriptional regulator [Rapidithrix thailandica]|uniref:LacI family DNA-binding transcriptional regulator n=1 Tax=Rapidithrix thailandica TaxID=413964 RepID=A0AAW9S345_9BACT
MAFYTLTKQVLINLFYKGKGRICLHFYGILNIFLLFKIQSIVYLQTFFYLWKEEYNRMGKKQTTIHDIAKELKLNASTVSRALNDDSRVKKETKELVKQTAKQLNYQPNTMASGLRKGRSNTLGVVIPRINRHFFSNVIYGIEAVTNKAGYHVIICQTDESYEKEVEGIETLLSARVDGILLSVSKQTKDSEHLKKIVDQGIHLLLFDRVFEELEVSQVVLDDFAGSFEAVEHLVAQGCRKIAHLGGPDYLNIYRNRRKGYLAALEKHGLEVKEEWVLEDALTKVRGREVIRELMQSEDKPDALFCASDFSALGAILQLKEMQVKIPEEVAVVGFANEPYTDIMCPTLTSVEQYSVQMGKYVAELFIEEIQSKQKQVKPQKIIVSPKLMIRESSLKK